MLIILKLGSVSLIHDWPTYHSSFVYQDLPACPCLELSRETHKANFYEEAGHFPEGDSQNKLCDQHSELHQTWESFPHPWQGPWWCQYPNSRTVILVRCIGKDSGTISIKISRSSMKEQQQYRGSVG